VGASDTANMEHRLKRLSALWTLALVPLAPLLFPPVLVCYAGFALAQETWAKGGLLLLALVLWFHLDRETRGRLNDNVTRVESALTARAAAAVGGEPVALILRSFRSDVAHSDFAASFSICELIEPALREAGFQPVALGRNLHLPPQHGVAFIETQDESWWEIFAEVARAAAVIVAFPHDTPSLRRELKWLAASGMVGKLALVMAPESLPVVYPTGDVPNVVSSADDAKRMQVWSEFRCIGAEDMGIELPGYDPRGALILFSVDGAVVSAYPLRTKTEKPTWFRTELNDDYRERYGIDFQPIWREAVDRHAWSGPPVRELWRRLAPAPLRIDRRAYFRPPGASGIEWYKLKRTMALGWGTALAFPLIALVGLVWNLL
jgi:hypothetical protein